LVDFLFGLVAAIPPVTVLDTGFQSLFWWIFFSDCVWCRYEVV